MEPCLHIGRICIRIDWINLLPMGFYGVFSGFRIFCNNIIKDCECSCPFWLGRDVSW